MTPDNRRARSRKTRTNEDKRARVSPRHLRWRGLTLALLLAIGPLAAGCTPGEIEGSFRSISVSFEEGGAERGLAEAIFVLNNAIPIIDMRLRSAFGP